MVQRFHIDVCGADGTHRAEVVIDGAGKRHLGIYRLGVGLKLSDSAGSEAA